MTNTTLKAAIAEAMEHYERHAEHEKQRAERIVCKGSLYHELMEAYQFNRGRAKAMKEALEYIEEFIG